MDTILRSAWRFPSPSPAPDPPRSPDPDQQATDFFAGIVLFKSALANMMKKRDRSHSRRRSRSPRRDRRRSYDSRSRSRSRGDYNRRDDRRSRSPINGAAGGAGYSSTAYPSDRGAAGAPPARGNFEDRSGNKEQMMNNVREQSQQDRRVYVGNLSYDVKWHHLKDFMRQGKVFPYHLVNTL